MAVLLLGRPWLGDWARGRQACVPQVMAIEQAVGREGLKLVLLTRLYPAVPSSLLNLAHGPSEVSLGDDVIGLIAILPGTMLFCSLGALAADGAHFGELSGDAKMGTWSPAHHQPGGHGGIGLAARSGRPAGPQGGWSR